VTPGEKWLLIGASAITLASALATSTGAGLRTDGSQRPGARGMGDDQYREGIGVDLALQLGFIQPDDHTRWHYGGGLPGQPIPSNWSRHRLAYPRRQGECTEQLQVTPMGSPAFPQNDGKWYYDPPADEGL
jgi:hypothetical protein